MIDEAKIGRVSDQISDLLEGLSIEEATRILGIHLTMLVLQGADGPKESLAFLDEIHRSVAHTVRRYPFGDCQPDRPQRANR